VHHQRAQAGAHGQPRRRSPGRRSMRVILRILLASLLMSIRLEGKDSSSDHYQRRPRWRHGPL